MDILVRNENASDVNEVEGLLFAAFTGHDEARAVELLRKSGSITIARVAEFDQRVVGHILFSPMTIEPAQLGFRGIGLAPLAVLPEFQRMGIGTKLVLDGVTVCQQLLYSGVFVLGDVAYYERFGFQPASKFDLTSEYNAGDAFMALELQPGSLAGFHGTVKYRPEFNQVGI